MDTTTISVIIALVAFAIFGFLYVKYGARRGKAEGRTARTWCMPPGHGDIGARRPSGEEMAPRDECPPEPAARRSA